MPLYSMRAFYALMIGVGLLEIFTNPLVGWTWQTIAGMQLSIIGFIGIVGLAKN